MIDSIGEFWSQEVFELLEDSGFDVVELFGLDVVFTSRIESDSGFLFAELFGADIRGHHDNGIFEVDPSSFAIFELSFIEDL